MTSGQHLLIRDRSEDLAEAVVELWRRPLLRQRVCSAALELARASYSWSAAADRIASSLGLPATASMTSAACEPGRVRA